MARRVKVAFIDCGIHPEFVPDDAGFERYRADASGVHINDSPGEISHGTLCFHVFKSRARGPYDLVDIKVLDSGTGTGNLEALVAALDWCNDKNIDLINMSMGTRQFADFAPLHGAVNALPEKTVIVSACSNTNELTAPAFFGRVAGVRYAKKEPGENPRDLDYYPKPYDGIGFHVSAKDLLLSLGSTEQVQLFGTNSFAAPVVTAALANLIFAGSVSALEAKLELEKTVVSPRQPSYSFHRSLFHFWKEIDVPIVSVPGGMTEQLGCLLRSFVEDGYRTICLTSFSEERGQAAPVFFLDEAPNAALHEKITLYFNLAMPDIIFLSIDAVALTELPPSLCAETILLGSPKSGAETLSAMAQFGAVIEMELREGVRAVFSRLVEVLS